MIGRRAGRDGRKGKACWVDHHGGPLDVPWGVGRYGIGCWLMRHGVMGDAAWGVGQWGRGRGKRIMDKGPIGPKGRFTLEEWKMENGVVDFEDAFAR